MIKRLPAAPALGPSKVHATLASTTYSEPRRGQPYSKPQTGNYTEQGHPILSALPYALRVLELLGISLGYGAAPYRDIGAVARLAVALKP
jgi:hypothetical protein